MLAQPLAPMGDYAHFLPVKLVSKPNGKTDKLPVDWRTGKVFLPGLGWQDDPTAVTSYDVVALMVRQLGPAYRVGFLFTVADPFFFLDLDNCILPSGEWTAGATTIVDYFVGAAVEVSQSGTGLHVFGSYQGYAPPHTCQYKPFDVDLFTDHRFATLTGDQAYGDAALDCTARLVSAIPVYWPPKEYTLGQEWTEYPVPEYTGPEDDDELIKKAMATKSAASAFSDRASFAELWTADEDALAKAYPDAHGQRPYDGSTADAGLIQHLCFWTGNNCERIKNLMYKSALVRDRWERADYMQRSILYAVSMQKTVYSVPKPGDIPDGPKMDGSKGMTDWAAQIRADKITMYPEHEAELLKIRSAKFWIDNQDTPAAEMLAMLAPIDGTAGSVDEVTFTTGYQYLNVEQQAEHFKGCMYVSKLHKVFIPSGDLLGSDQFKAVYGGYLFECFSGENSKPSRNAWEAFTENQLVRYPIAADVCFRPEKPSGARLVMNNRALVNTYVPIDTPKQAGDASRFVDHVAKILPVPRDQEIVLSYMAAVIQYKGVKFQWAPLIQGAPGNGKSLLTYCMQAAVGEDYTHMPPASEIGEKFNAWLFNRLFIGVEDIYIPGEKRELVQILLPMITASRYPCRDMRAGQIMRDMCCNFIFNSNFKDAVRKTQDDRRFCIFYCAQQSAADIIRDGMGGNYFPSIYKWLKKEGGFAIVHDFLAKYEIAEEFNPTTLAHRAPETSSTAAAIAEGLGSVEQHIIEEIEQDRPGFRGGWISSHAVDMLLKDLRKDGAISPNKRRTMLNELGYDWHPALNNGRVNNPVAPDNRRCRLFVKPGHLSLNLTSPAQIAKAYEDAQGAAGANMKSNVIDAAKVFGG